MADSSTLDVIGRSGGKASVEVLQVTKPSKLAKAAVDYIARARTKPKGLNYSELLLAKSVDEYVARQPKALTSTTEPR